MNTIFKKSISVVIMLCVLFSITSCGTKPFSDNTEAMNNASKSVVLINVYSENDELLATGSGFFAFDDSTIITNYHVISNAFRIEGISDNDKTFDIPTIYAFNKDKDIAILKTSDEFKCAPLKLSDNNSSQKGEKVVAIGSPLGFKNTISNGTISNFQIENDITYIQFTALITNGSSGGALFNDAGEVIGMTSMGLVEDNIFFAIPSNEIQKVYHDNHSEYLIADFYDKYVIPTIKGGTLLVGTSPDFYPWEDIDSNGNIYGIEPDILKEMGKIFDLEIEFVPMSFDELLPSLAIGKIDCVASGMDYVGDRRVNALISNPVCTVGGEYGFSSVMYIAPNNVKLQTAINNAIVQLTNNGTIKDILLSYDSKIVIE